jgi:hypothetical protein
MMQTIGLIGKGFVGTAVYEGMKHAFDILAWDKANGWEGDGRPYPRCDPVDRPILYLVENTDGPIFVCVPTPMRPDGSADTSIVESVILEVDKASQELGQLRVAIIKSTVPPGTTSAINEKVENLQVCFNPEFFEGSNSY